MYVYERDASHPSGRLSFITTVPGSDAWEWNTSDQREPNTTADGRFLVFRSRGDLTGDDSSGQGAAQVFRYDAQTGRLQRISIGSQGFNDNGNRPTTACDAPRSLGAGETCPEDALIVAAAASIPNYRADPTMSDDGSRVFFMSPVGLTAHALNDVPVGTNPTTGMVQYAENVYEWEQPGVGSCPAGESTGCVYLISDGQDTGAAIVNCGSTSTRRLTRRHACWAATRAARTAFFYQLGSAGAAGHRLRTGQYLGCAGGWWVPVRPPPADCSGDACQGQPGASPPVPVVATVTFSGPGNQTRCRRASSEGGAPDGPGRRVTLIVPARRVTLTGAGIKRVARSMSHAGSYRLRVALTGKERRALARKHRLKLRLKVSYAPAGGEASTVGFSITDRARSAR